MNRGSFIEWAGVGIIVGMQVATFLYTLRRMDAMQQEINEVKVEMRERLARLEGILIGRNEVSNGTFTQTGDD